jgi:WD40 repeat protein
LRYSLLAGAAALLVIGGVAFGLRVDQPEIAQSGRRVEAQLEHVIALGDSPAREPRFSRDGRFLALTNAAGSIHVVRTSDWKPVRRFEHPGGATSAVFTPDGGTLFTSGYDGMVRSFDLATGTPGTAIKASETPLWTLDISSDGRQLAIGDEAGVARVWVLYDPRRPAKILRGHGRNIWEVQFSPSAPELATGSFDYTARIWDVASGTTVRELRGHSQAIVGLDYRPDGRLIATSGDDSTIRLWRLGDGKQVGRMDAGNHTYDVEFSPDGKWLASAGRARSALGTALHALTGLWPASPPVHIWRMSDGAPVAALPHGADVSRLAYAPDGRHLVTADDAGRVRIWRVAAR